MVRSVSNSEAVSLFKTGLEELKSVDRGTRDLGLKHIRQACEELGNDRIAYSMFSSEIKFHEEAFGTDRALYLNALCHFGKEEQVYAIALELAKILQNEGVGNREALEADLKMCARFLTAPQLAKVITASAPQTQGQFEGRFAHVLKPVISQMRDLSEEDSEILAEAVIASRDGLPAWLEIEKRIDSRDVEWLSGVRSQVAREVDVESPPALKPLLRLEINHAIKNSAVIDFLKAKASEQDHTVLQTFMEFVFDSAPEESKKDILTALTKAMIATRSSSPASGRRTPNSGDSGIEIGAYPKRPLSGNFLKVLKDKGLINQEQYNHGMKKGGFIERKR